MAAPGAALRFKRLRQRFVGISAPKMAIRTHVAWYWRALVMVGVLSLSVLLAAWVYDTGLRMAGCRSKLYAKAAHICCCSTRTKQMPADMK